MSKPLRDLVEALRAEYPALQAEAEKKNAEAKALVNRAAAVQRMLQDAEIALGLPFGSALAPPDAAAPDKKPEKFDLLAAIDRVLLEAGTPISGTKVILGVVKLAIAAGAKPPAAQTVRSAMSENRETRGWSLDMTKMPPLWSVKPKETSA